MSILRKIRLGAAIVLLCAIFLPLSECSRHEKNLRPAQKSFLQQWFPQDNADFAYRYAFREMHLSNWQEGGVALVALLWPLAALLFDKKLQRRRFAWVAYAIELLLCAGSLYWLYAFTSFGRLLYGAYVVCTAMAAFAIATIILVVDHFRGRSAKTGT